MLMIHSVIITICLNICFFLSTVITFLTCMFQVSVSQRKLLIIHKAFAEQQTYQKIVIMTVKQNSNLLSKKTLDIRKHSSTSISQKANFVSKHHLQIWSYILNFQTKIMTVRIPWRHDVLHWYSSSNRNIAYHLIFRITHKETHYGTQVSSYTYIRTHVVIRTC